MNINDLNILFIDCQWCDGNPAVGLSNGHHNIFGSLKHSHPNIKFNTIFFDECQVKHNTHIDNILSKVQDKYKPNVIITTLLANSPINPTLESLKKLKETSLLCFMWPDLTNGAGIKEFHKYNEIADLHISLASEGNIENEKLISLWTPEDPHLYYPGTQKAIEVLFLGRIYPDRQQYLQHALSKGLPLTIGGGQREQKLTPDLYASTIRNSKISINFPISPGNNIIQLKGRVFETLASNTMLMEGKNQITSKFLKPDVDYVEFISLDDFVDKIKYYLTNDEERIKISNSGCEKFNKQYSAY